MAAPSHPPIEPVRHGARWTDHNASDPGITILEVLAFAVVTLAIGVLLHRHRTRTRTTALRLG